MDVRSPFQNKVLFITGATGFLGKVLLFTILRELKVQRVFVLVRPKKNVSPHQRLQQEVFSSKCFDPLRSALGDEEWRRRAALVVPVVGDIMLDRLGLSEEDYATVAEQTHIYFHLAATIDFREVLNVSAQMNVLGTLRVVQLARRSPRLEAIVHTSTCYVNYARASTDVPIEEKVYPLDVDAEDLVQTILSTEGACVEALTQRLLKRYGLPNTYTLTKCLTEHILLRYADSLPIIIVRPSIIACSYRDPCPGWVDVLTAAGGIILTSGLGILAELHANVNYIADIVPVDFVVNVLLKAAARVVTAFPRPAKADGAEGAPKWGRTTTLVDAKCAVAPAGTLAGATARGPPSDDVSSARGGIPFIVAAATSDSPNHMVWQTSKRSLEFFYQHPARQAIRRPQVELIEQRWKYLMRFYGLSVLPYLLMKAGTFDAQRKKLLQRYERALRRSADLNEQFAPFTTKMWIFSARNARMLDEGLSDESRAAFSSDPLTIVWGVYMNLYAYGLSKFILKNDVPSPVVPSSGRDVYLRASL